MTNELKTTLEIVKTILTENEEARNNDDFLYGEVIEQYDKMNDTNAAGMPVFFFLLRRASLGIPSFETVRRTRQKVQADFPALAGNEKTRKARAEKREEFRAFAKGGGY